MIGKFQIRSLRVIFARIRIKLAQNIAACIPFGSRFCCYCKKSSPYFLPYKSGTKGMPTLMQNLNVIGSDVDNHTCPKCGSHDRERLLKLYLNASLLGAIVRGKKVLHFAPESKFSKHIQMAEPKLYIQADLYPISKDVLCVDLMSTTFEDATFNLVIANHVLEHVSNVSTALNEIHRILTVNGFALLQVPYSTVLTKTFEDEGIVTPEARLQAYGQEDHVRLFGRDIIHFIESFGFEAKVRRHQDNLIDCDASLHGVNMHEPLFLFKAIK